jgi:thiopeptide-type bacteriocin biosynthesis protein
MKLSIFEQAIYRVPQFNANANLKDSWDELKQSIKLSSSDFYDQIKDTDADEVHNLSTPLFNTVWKYFNRSRFRATPYGRFAGFGLVNLSDRKANGFVSIKSSQKIHSFIAWPVKNNIPLTVELLLEDGGYLIANNTWYTVLNSIRYLSYINDKFELSEIQKDYTVCQILQTCLTKIKAAELQEAILSLFSNRSQFYEAINYMISLQLLLTSRHPNIIGDEYFERMGVINTPFLPQYVIAETPNISGTIHNKAFKNIPELALRLHQVVSSPNNPALDKFITDFTNKFERREVPLMEALDPELGIGYGDLEHSSEPNNLVADMVLKKKEVLSHHGDQQLKDFLYKELIQHTDVNNLVIQLEKLPEHKNVVKAIPNTFNAVFSDACGLLCLESLGGVTSNATAGRFTLTGDKMTTYCKRIADIERQANPEVLFFDIGYIAENDVDNINRRRSIYELQLNLLNYDLSEEPMQISDLFLSVYRGELILKSKKLNKRLVPRMASAYNYGRSDLPLFRLLCDLQSQGLASNLSIKIQHLLPGLTYYPRIQFKDIIISRAKWLLSFADFQQQAEHESLDHFIYFLNQYSISRYFRTGAGDQTLFFDLTAHEDMSVFMDYFKKKKLLLLEEAFLGPETLIKDGKGRAYYNEWIIGLYHHNEIYKATKPTSGFVESKHLAAIIPPGEEWLYFEIFSHPNRADSILSNHIATLLRRRRKLIRHWFFIRYTENGFHLRLRLRLNNAGKGQDVITELSDLLKTEIQTGIVSDFTIRTYKRELARYGSLNMEQVEAHFHIDSTYVLNIVELSPEANTLYATCREIVLYLRDSGVFNTISFDDLLNRISISMNEEHQVNPSSFKKLNEAYKTYRKAMPLMMNLHQSLKDFADSFFQTLSLCVPSARNQLFTDLMHMHINRLFSAEQRTHEMIFYYFLTKEMKEKNARGKLNAIA